MLTYDAGPTRDLAGEAFAKHYVWFQALRRGSKVGIRARYAKLETCNDLNVTQNCKLSSDFNKQFSYL